MTDLLKDRRPYEVTADIERQFQVSPQSEYRHTGQASTYYWYTHPPLTTSDVLDKPGLSVLDVGCGAGQVIRRYEQESELSGSPAHVLGITATQYADENPSIKVADMHDLMVHAGYRRWQRIITNHTLMHSPDALAVFEQMLNLTETGGTVTTDMFGRPDYIGGYRRFRGSEVKTVIQYLVKSGHFAVRAFDSTIKQRTIADNPPFHMPELHLQRLSSPDISEVLLPVEYEVNTQGLWHYKAESQPTIIHGTSTKFAMAVTAMRQRR